MLGVTLTHDVRIARARRDAVLYSSSSHVVRRDRREGADLCLRAKTEFFKDLPKEIESMKGE